jgi:predicted nuclease of predicted toxin-antitoxin system
MNLSPAWVTELARHGHEALHWRDVGLDNAPDEEIIAWAAREGRTILTADLDLAATIVATATGISVVQLRSGSTNPARVGDFVLEAIAWARTELRAGAVLTVEPGRTRLRILASPSSSADEI